MLIFEVVLIVSEVAVLRTVTSLILLVVIAKVSRNG